MMRLLSVSFLIVVEVMIIPAEEYGYQIQILNGTYSTDINLTVSNTRESIIRFEDSASYYPYTVFAWSNLSGPEFPVFITVRQQKEATAWEIPLLVKSREGMLSFHKTSRTLCHNNINLISQMAASRLHTYNHFDRLKSGVRKRLTMSVSTAYDIPTDVTVRVEEQKDFYITLNQNYSATISPSEPRFFYYKFPDVDNSDTGGTVILEVESLDDTCLTVSIQNATCPVFDLNEDISYEGEYETINTKGGIIVKETDYPNGFFVVLVAKGDNFDCDQKNSVIPLQEERKIIPSNHSSMVIFKIRRNIATDKYIVVSLSTLAGFLIFYVIFGVVYCEFCSSNTRCQAFGYSNLYNVEEPDRTSNDSVQAEIPTELCSTSTEAENTNVEIHQNFDSPDVIRIQSGTITEDLDTILDCSQKTLYHSVEEDDVIQTKESATNTEVSQEEATDNETSNVLQTVDQRLLSPQLFLSDLSTKQSKHIHRESINYFLHVISIGIFYGIPVFQLVITHQRIVMITGNLDMCYYNFLCAHPFIGLNDYNHVLSNIGYILLGILFLIITRLHRKMRQDDNCGIPKHYGLFYAMGTALIMEGFLSMCYHVCPNQSNFQFDTSFMYVMAVLCIIKLYQNRHPDINATAYVTFLILAVTVLIAVVGILNGHILVWILFIFLYSVLSLFIAIKIYFVNQSRRGLELVYETRKSAGFLQAIKPIKTEDGKEGTSVSVNSLERAKLLPVGTSKIESAMFFCYKIKVVDYQTSIANIVCFTLASRNILTRCTSVVVVTILNIIMVNMGYLFYFSDVDFGTYVLMLLMGNAIIYTLIYVVMKVKCKERLCIQSILYLIAAAILWGFSVHFFINNSSQWMVTPAESRHSNIECPFFDFYDNHDIWHLLSAGALFFSFMMLLTLDDELVHMPRNTIVVF